LTPKGSTFPELFKQVLDDLSEFPQAKVFGYNLELARIGSLHFIRADSPSD
jgi:hypothetical protein